jgi:hypothetical protein
MYHYGGANLVGLLINTSPQLRENFKNSDKAERLGAIVLKIGERKELEVLAEVLLEKELTPILKLSLFWIQLRKIRVGKTAFGKKRLLLALIAIIWFLVLNGVIPFTLLFTVMSEAIQKRLSEADINEYLSS